MTGLRAARLPSLHRFGPALSLILAVAAAGHVGSVFAVQAEAPLVTDRPDFTESTATVAPGRFQVEAGYTFTRSGELEAHTLGELLVRIGAQSWAELRLGLNSFTWVDAPGLDVSGLEDIEVGAKIGLLRPGPSASRSTPEIALLAGTTLPTGDDRLGQDELQPGGTLALAWSLSERLALGSNLGGAYLSEEGDRFWELSGSAALGYGLTERLGAYLEVFGFVPEARANSSFFNGGFTFLVTPGVQADTRGGLRLDESGPDYFLGAGLSWRR